MLRYTAFERRHIALEGTRLFASTTRRALMPSGLWFPVRSCPRS